jgi:hypothetical protein
VKAKSYPSIGVCIYCYRSPTELEKAGISPKLTREHIISFGINGLLVFAKASCSECARTINKGFEQHFLKRLVIEIRTLKKMQTNHPAQRPTTFKRGVRHQTGTTWTDVPAEQHPVLLAFPVLNAPAALSGEPIKGEMGWEISAMTALFSPDALNKFGFGSCYFEFQPEAFGRFFAKVAHGFATAELGRDGFEPVLVPIILGTDKVMGRYIGSSQYECRLHYSPHKIDIRDVNGWAVVSVQLFADFDATSRYDIVAGRLTQNGYDKLAVIQNVLHT